MLTRIAMIECRHRLRSTVLVARGRPASDLNLGCAVAGVCDQPFELSAVQPNASAFWTTINFNSSPLHRHQVRRGANRALPLSCNAALGLLPPPLYLHFD